MSFRLLSRSQSLLNRSLLLQHQPARCLNLQEYESKEIMSSHGLRVQDFRVVSSPEEISSVSRTFTCKEYVIKAQVLAGGRGKGHFKNSGLEGGVRLTRDAAEAGRLASCMLNDYLITAQTPPGGILVHKVMIAQALDIDHEYYAAILLDRESSANTGIVLVASKCGGMDIEKVAHEDPDAIHKFPLPLHADSLTRDAACDMVRKGLGIRDETVVAKAADQIIALHRLFLKTDATMIEVTLPTFLLGINSLKYSDQSTGSDAGQGGCLL